MTGIPTTRPNETTRKVAKIGILSLITHGSCRVFPSAVGRFIETFLFEFLDRMGNSPGNLPGGTEISGTYSWGLETGVKFCSNRLETRGLFSEEACGSPKLGQSCVFLWSFPCRRTRPGALACPGGGIPHSKGS